MALFLKDGVLAAIADDYEDLDSILRFLNVVAHVNTEAKQVSDMLRELVGEGLAQSYELQTAPPTATSVDFDATRIAKLWFYITPRGKLLVRSRDTNL